jgi:predicted SAM-dependent methyltransferase
MNPNLNVGCGEFSRPGWLNTDFDPSYAHPGHDFLQTTPEEPFPFPDDTFERVYCGHVIEHVPYADVPYFLANVRRILRPGGELCVVGPDTFKTLHEWHAGREPWDLVTRVLESHHVLTSDDRHHWNCEEGRMVGLLQRAGFTTEVFDMSTPQSQLSTWPVVAYTAWQFGILAAAA